MTTYTADDFTNARFATHPDGRIAARIGRDLPWVMPCVENCESVGLECNGLDNAPSTFMSKEGWVPVRESKGNQARNEQKRIDHIQEQDRIIRRRNEQIAAQVEIIEEVRRDLDDYQATHTRQIETIARLQKTVQHLRAITGGGLNDAMIRRAAHSIAKSREPQTYAMDPDGTAETFDAIALDALTAALTEPPSRPEGAEEIEAYMRELVASHPEDHYGKLADHLASRGVLPPLTDKSEPSRGVRVTGAES